MWIAGIILLFLFWMLKKGSRSNELPGIPPPEPVSAFWRPGVYNYEGNLYERAVLRNETIDFLLGKGVYYQPGDYCRQHEALYAFNSMIGYANVHGSEKMLFFLKRDIILLLEKDMNPERLFLLVNYIVLYLGDYDKVLDAKWEIGPDIKTAIRQHINRFAELYGTEGGPFDCNIPRHEFYTRAIIDEISKIKQKFGVDLMLQ